MFRPPATVNLSRSSSGTFSLLANEAYADPANARDNIPNKTVTIQRFVSIYNYKIIKSKIIIFHNNCLQHIYNVH